MQVGGMVGQASTVQITGCSAQDAFSSCQYPGNGVGVQPLLRTGLGERLLATGRVERAGRTLTVVRGDVEAIEGGRSTAVALMQGTMMCLLPPG